MTDTSGNLSPTAPPDETALRRAADNWQTARAALVERIRQRWTALSRLASDALEVELIETQLQTVGDDAAALLHLADQVDHCLDQAFATRSRRAAVAEPVKSGPRLRADHEEFRTR